MTYTIRLSVISILLGIIILITGCGGGGGGGTITPTSISNDNSNDSTGGAVPDIPTEETPAADDTDTAIVDTNIALSGTVLSPMPLLQIKTWAYQIQGLETSTAITKLVNSKYDMLVLEPTCTEKDSDFNTKAMIDRLKLSYSSDNIHRKLIIAYIDVGEAESWRYYWTWSTSWASGTPKPSDWPNYIICANLEGWAGDYPVAYWDAKWKDIVMYGQNQGSGNGDYKSLIDEAIVHGFDGVYLDCIQNYEDSPTVSRAKQDGTDSALEMIKFIKEIKDYANSKKPGFIIIQQNAADLGYTNPELLNYVDAIAQEAVWYDGTAYNNWSSPNGGDKLNSANLSNYYIQRLAYYKNAGKPVFDIEYAIKYAADAYQKSKAQGYIPYCSRRPLSKLSTTPPFNYM